MESERCKVELCNPINSYNSGETIKGKVTIKFEKPRKIRGIYFKIIGHGKCHWSELYTRESTIHINQHEDGKGKEKRAISYNGKEEYLATTVYLVGAKNGPPFELPDGEHTYNFSYDLPNILPSSFRGTYGKIKYKMEFIIDKPWQFDEKFEVPLSITKSLDYKNHPLATKSQELSVTKKVGFLGLGTGPILVRVYLAKTGWAPGEKVPIQVELVNDSGSDVDKIKFIMRKVIRYNSFAPPNVCKEEILQLLKKEAGGVEKKTVQRYEHKLEIPAVPPSDDTYSRIVHIRYEIRVEAKLFGHKNLVLTIPIVIGTSPLVEQPLQTEQRPNQLVIPEGSTLNINASSQFVYVPVPVPMYHLANTNSMSTNPIQSNRSMSLQNVSYPHPVVPNPNTSLPYPPVNASHDHLFPSSSIAMSSMGIAPPLNEIDENGEHGVHPTAPPSYDDLMNGSQTSFASSSNGFVGHYWTGSDEMKSSKQEKLGFAQ